MVGRTLSHYEIAAKLGHGGMGEVYLAFDSRLGRRVALKVLPPDVAEDVDRRKRLEREAKALAALNHPHIVTVYSVEESDGIHFITMELVEGKTLSAIISTNGLSLERFLDLAIPLADALGSAHAHGVTHRDLKPTNIMVSAEGRLKVLDFGLAKNEHATAGAGLAEQPTRSLTEVGRIVGTVNYMSPEQAEGKSLDHRTDVFSLGIVFYEMLTGRHPFLGDSPVSTLSAILKDMPRSVTELNPDVPRELGKVVRRCLAKEPSRRYQSCIDLRNELEDLKGELGTSGDAPSVSIVSRPTGKRIVWATLGVALGVVLTLTAIALTGLDSRRRAAKPEVIRFRMGPPDGGSFAAVNAHPQPAISPDGRHVAFVASTEEFANHVWVCRLDATSPQVLQGTNGADYPFWSPDSKQIGYFSDGHLRKISISGGPPQTLAEGDNGGTWNSEGFILFGGADGIYRVSSQGGEATPVTRLDPSRREFSHRYPIFLPDGRHFFYLALAEEAQNHGVYIGSVDSKENKRLLSDASNVAWAPPGYLFFVRENTLLVQSFEVTRLQLTGEPTIVAERVMPGPTVRFAPFSVSNDVLAYRTGGWSFTTQLTWLDRQGLEHGTVSAAGLNNSPSLSLDEKRVAFARWDRKTNFDIWMTDLSKSITERLTSDPAFEYWPVWSPDGEQIAFSSSRRGTWDVYRKNANALAPEELFFRQSSGTVVETPHDWSSDGRTLLVESSADLWIVPLSGDVKPFTFLKTEFGETQPRLSRDGRWLAYVSDESGTQEVYVQEFPQGGRRWRVSTRGGMDPRWRADGRELFYLEPGPLTGTSHVVEATFMSVRVQTGNDFDASAPEPLFHVRVPAAWIQAGWAYAVAAQGQRFLFNKVIDVEPELITIVLNWRETLAQSR